MPVRVIAGDCRTALQELPSESVHCILTSPPYFNLRSYLPDGHADKAKELGLEQTPDDYVAEIVAVFREARRVLRDDGTAWINLGDSYNTNPSTSVIPRAEQGNGSGAFRIPGQEHVESRKAQPNKATPLIRAGIKKKDLIGIPWMVAFALRADGWYLRQDNIWQKTSCMPESVTDRTTRSHEYVFMFSKSQRYFYDAVAVSEPAATFGRQKTNGMSPKLRAKQELGHFSKSTGLDDPYKYELRNRRSVWTIATEPSGLAHYAMMPTALAEICIKAGTSEKGCCPHCGAGWVRQAERTTASVMSPRSGYGHDASRRDGGRSRLVGAKTETLGWQPSCSCPEHDPVPATILDCFAGAGTTGLVADRLGRSAILIELSETNVAMARDRLEGDAGLFAEVSAG